jgi:Winged helix DNA-binding domain
VPDGPLPDPETPAPPRFLPEFDNVLIAHVHRSRIIPPRYHRQAIANLGTPMVVIDGFVAGFWGMTRDDGSATLEVRLLHRIPDDERDALTMEAGRLLDFAAPDSKQRSVYLVTAQR